MQRHRDNQGRQSLRLSDRYPVSSMGQMRSPLSSRNLDLLLLAGCSCLLTLLYHPVAESLQSSATVARTSSIPLETSIPGTIDAQVKAGLFTHRSSLRQQKAKPEAEEA